MFRSVVQHPPAPFAAEQAKLEAATAAAAAASGAGSTSKAKGKGKGKEKEVTSASASAASGQVSFGNLQGKEDPGGKPHQEKQE